jgi:hypothetical protein
MLKNLGSEGMYITSACPMLSKNRKDSSIWMSVGRIPMETQMQIVEKTTIKETISRLRNTLVCLYEASQGKSGDENGGDGGKLSDLGLRRLCKCCG